MEQVLSSVLRLRSEMHPQRPAYTFEGRTFTYAQLLDGAQHAADRLVHLGLRKGDRVGLLDLNGPAAVHLICGAVLQGIVPVSMPWKTTPEEVRALINDAGIAHFFAGDMFQPLAKGLQVEGLTLHPIESHTPHPSAAVTDVSPADLCTIIYTSGTTGTPKGVMLSHANVHTCATLCGLDTPSFGPDARLLVCGPLYSIFGFGAFFSGIHAGATCVLARAFEPQATLQLMQAERITHALFAPIMMRAMAAVPNANAYDLSALKHIQYGGSPISPELLLDAHRLFHCDFTQVYGLTETSGIGCALRYDEHRRLISGDTATPSSRIASAGKPNLGIGLRVADEKDRPVSQGEVGEVQLKGSLVSMGYWGSPKETAERRTADGWLRTGDMGRLDASGFLVLVDRKNDMIVSKGVNIFPAEIEAVINTHPAVRESAVVSAPHEEFGEEVCAVVVPKEKAPLLEEMRKWCAGKVADHKLPSRLIISEGLPRNLTGKVLRRLVKAPLWQGETRNIKG
jgi:long-chain acyl-CoA synthetase